MTHLMNAYDLRKQYLEELEKIKPKLDKHTKAEIAKLSGYTVHTIDHVFRVKEPNLFSAWNIIKAYYETVKNPLPLQ